MSSKRPKSQEKWEDLPPKLTLLIDGGAIKDMVRKKLNNGLAVESTIR